MSWSQHHQQQEKEEEQAEEEEEEEETDVGVKNQFAKMLPTLFSTIVW